MKIGGMGYAILRVTAAQLRELHTIPTDVVFTRTLESNRSAWNSTIPAGWYHDEHPFYFRIQHRYLPRTHDRGPLYVISLSELLKQMTEVAAQEASRRGEKIRPDSPEAQGDTWVDDDGGEDKL